MLISMYLLMRIGGRIVHLVINGGLMMRRREMHVLIKHVLVRDHIFKRISSQVIQWSLITEESLLLGVLGSILF